MKRYVSPEVEFVEFDSYDNMDIATSECDGYVCPNMYGGTCSGNPYAGS